MKLLFYKRKMGYFLLILLFTFVILEIHWILSFVPPNPFALGHSNPKSTTFAPIPRNIFQSWKTDEIPRMAQDAVKSWETYNPTFNYTFFNDTMAKDFVQREYPHLFNMFQTFPKDVMRSDFFRYLVVLRYGGYWSDIDTICLKPINQWTPPFKNNVSAIIGVELDASDVVTDWFSVQLQFCQWTFGFAKGHPLLKHVIDYITARFNSNSSTDSIRALNSVHLVTGPTIWTMAILDYLGKLGYTNSHAFRFLKEPIVVSDILILPITAFSPDNIGMRGQGPKGRDSLVKHLFMGSWHTTK